MKPALVLVSLALSTAAAVAAPVEPIAVELPEQAAGLGPSSLRVQVDTGLVSGVPDTEAHNGTMVLDLRLRARRWMLSASFGAQTWSDRAVGVVAHETRGLQPTNLNAHAVRWMTPVRAWPLQLGLHLAVMIPTARGLPDPPSTSPAPDDETGDWKAPSQRIRLAALPFDRPEETVGKLGLVLRADEPRWVAQAEVSFDVVHVAGHAPDASKSRWWLAAGAGYRVTPSLAVVLHALAQRGYRAEDPDATAVGGGLHLALPRGTASLRGERVLGDCDLGQWVPLNDHRGRCSRVVADYTLPL